MTVGLSGAAGAPAPDCRGSFIFNSACGRCAKCLADPSNPANGAPALVGKPEVNVTVLALDLGTKTGYALRRRDGEIIHGMQDFTPRGSWSPGQRGLRFRAWLGEVLAKEQPNLIAYEEVLLHQGTIAAHVYGLFEGLVWMTADTRNIAVQSQNFAHVKKHWTGTGNAKKDAMLAQARARGFRPVDDNAADALAILHLALAKERGEWSPPPARPKPKRKPAPVLRRQPSKVQGALL